MREGNEHTFRILFAIDQGNFLAIDQRNFVSFSDFFSINKRSICTKTLSSKKERNEKKNQQ
jgi:hypothetical protein